MDGSMFTMNDMINDKVFFKKTWQILCAVNKLWKQNSRVDPVKASL